MTIEKVWNGYIVECPSLAREVYATLDEVLARALQHFEGRASTFTGDSYGRVVIERDKEAPPVEFVYLLECQSPEWRGRYHHPNDSGTISREAAVAAFGSKAVFIPRDQWRAQEPARVAERGGKG